MKPTSVPVVRTREMLIDALCRSEHHYLPIGIKPVVIASRHEWHVWYQLGMKVMWDQHWSCHIRWVDFTRWNHD